MELNKEKRKPSKIVIALFWIIFGIIFFGVFTLSADLIDQSDNSTIEDEKVVVYSKQDMKVTIKESGLFGDTYGTIELKSHSSVTEIRKVGFGDYQAVMYYDFTDWELYENGLGNIYFTNIKTGKEINKLYYFAEWRELVREVPIYEKPTLDKDGGFIYSGEIIGYENQTYYQWVKYNSRDIPNTKTETRRIALMVYTEDNEYTDAVWTLAGERIEKHAGWTAGLNNGLIAYYNLDDVNDALGIYNLTNSGSVAFETGLIGDNAFFGTPNAGGTELTIANDLGIQGMGVCFSAWVNVTITPGANEHGIVTQVDATSDVAYQLVYHATGPKLRWIRADLGVGGDVLDYTTTLPINGDYQHIVGCDDTINLFLYLNGVPVKSVPSATTNGSFTLDDEFIIGGNVQTANRDWDGFIDEVGVWSRNLSTAEVVQLYNGGAGITYGPVGNAIATTLNSPIDTINWANFTAPLNMSASVTTGDIVLENTTLHLWFSNGTTYLIDTDSLSGTEDTNTWTKTLVSDSSLSYIWNVYSASNESETDWGDANFTFTIGLNTSGTLKYSNGSAVNIGTVTATYQINNSFAGRVNSTSTGAWTIGPLPKGDYLITGYYRQNSSIDGDVEAHVVIP